MKVLKKVNFSLLLLLGVATGLVKIVGMEEEMTLFSQAGIGDLPTRFFGVLQLLFALLLLLPKTIKPAAIALAVTFAFATTVVFINGMIPFGFVSLLFIAMALFAWFSGPIFQPSSTK